jgi:two-component system CheB/CheR fusion protein
LYTASAEPAAVTLPPRHRRGQQQSQLALLERELAGSREYLQSIIQELEAANEELQSANEEILSSNEELQSTNEELDTAKEELQSSNEELNTLNEELHGRNEELSRVNSDLVNLLASVQIAIVIISSDLRIRRFTPMAKKVLNLIPGDLDRPIGHIKPNIDCPDLEQLIVDSMDSVAPVERDVRDQSGRWYSLRIRPYKNVENKIDGAVLTLFDVDVPKRSEQRIRLASELGVTPSALVGKHLSELHGAWNLAAVHERLRGWANVEGGFERVPIEQNRECGPPKFWLTGRWLPWHESPDSQVLLLAISAYETGASSNDW